MKTVFVTVGTTRFFMLLFERRMRMRLKKSCQKAEGGDEPLAVDYFTFSSSTTDNLSSISYDDDELLPPANFEEMEKLRRQFELESKQVLSKQQSEFGSVSRPPKPNQTKRVQFEDEDEDEDENDDEEEEDKGTKRVDNKPPLTDDVVPT
ncbi:hypothetical protein DVH24_031359 [Malus domestica]|uniref:Uncharacterized protein n=1 Tax=Malus domestica TaxID=3750 RepID=A0A498HC34_MALDO|nr:hypothetical protein DVH24_031359 [Malus domestica]